MEVRCPTSLSIRSPWLPALPEPSRAAGLAASRSGPLFAGRSGLKKGFFTHPGALPLRHVHIHSPRLALCSPSGLTEDRLRTTVPDLKLQQPTHQVPWVASV